METGLVIIGLLYVALSVWAVVNLFFARPGRTRG
jgi:hypothetical protein